MMEKPLLSISIPTWNRASYLKLTLEQLFQELRHVSKSEIEIIVSDNCSEDDTRKIVQSFMDKGLDIRYVRNNENIGSDRNIAQCYNLAKGKYVLLLGDDDIPLEGVMPWLLCKIRNHDYGVIYLRQYGYDNDFRKEFPGIHGNDKIYTDAGAFLERLGASSTLISSNVISKKVLGSMDAAQFCGSNLVQAHLVFRAALKASRNLYTTCYKVACKRNNSGGYDFAKVFVGNFGEIMEQCRHLGLEQKALRSIENRMLIGYYPYYMWRIRAYRKENPFMVMQEFEKRFAHRAPYIFFVRPILVLPRLLALIWGGMATGLGRTMTGDMRRGLYFAWNRLASK